MKNETSAPCHVCGATAWQIGHFFDCNDRIRYPWFCTQCGHRTALYVSYAEGGKQWRPLADGKPFRQGSLFGGAS